MSCDSFQEDFLEYRANRLSPSRAKALGEHLRTCLDCQRAWADFQEIDRVVAKYPAPVPTENLRRNFYAMLDTHLAVQREPGVFAPVRRGLARLRAEWLPANPFAQLAATALLVACAVIGTLLVQTRRERDADLTALRRQVDAVTRLVAYTALDRQPASGRVQAVLATDTDTDTGLAELLGAVAQDPNINVRISALESLYPHATVPAVRSGVLAALTRETSPIVQVAMIDFLANAKATEAQTHFELLAHDPSVNSTVRAAASNGLVQLL